MSRSVLIGVLFALLLGGGASPALAQEHDEAVTAAKKAAQEWLALLDDDRYEATYKTASSYFKSSVSADDWTEKIESAHRNLPSVESRSEASAQFKTSVPNAPDGEYVIIQYKTTYDSKKTVETLTMKKEGDAWAVAGYSVNPARPEK